MANGPGQTLCLLNANGTTLMHPIAELRVTVAGAWYASPATHVSHELIAAGMLILAGGGRDLPLDYEELERWTRVGYERGTRSRHGER
jgi:hypothetical protein